MPVLSWSAQLNVFPQNFPLMFTVDGRAQQHYNENKASWLLGNQWHHFESLRQGTSGCGTVGGVIRSSNPHINTILYVKNLCYIYRKDKEWGKRNQARPKRLYQEKDCHHQLWWPIVNKTALKSDVMLEKIFICHKLWKMFPLYLLL